MELDVDFQAHAVLEYDDIAVRDEGNLDLELDFTVEKGDQKELPLTYSFCARFGARFNYRNPSKSSSKSNMRSNFIKILTVRIDIDLRGLINGLQKRILTTNNQRTIFQSGRGRLLFY